MNLNIRVLKHSTPPPGRFSIFTIVKNEAYIIPFFLEHYRSLGARSFVIFDDGSTDGTLELITKQEDCMVMVSETSFGTVIGMQPNGIPLRFGPRLKTLLPEKLVPKDWMIVVDADEFLVLPCGFSTLNDILPFLESQNYLYITSPMVDFYPKILSERNYNRNINPFIGSPFFDRGPLYDWMERIVPMHYPAGIRYRLLQKLILLQPNIVKTIYGNHPVLLAKNWKVPLLKNGHGVTRINDHEINVIPNHSLICALAHFKFTPDLDKKIQSAISSKSYYNGSMEYRFLQSSIKYLDQENLLSTESIIYTGPRSLLEGKLLSDYPSPRPPLFI
jgi:hypothetical protein